MLKFRVGGEIIIYHSSLRYSEICSLEVRSFEKLLGVLDYEFRYL